MLRQRSSGSSSRPGAHRRARAATGSAVALAGVALGAASAAPASAAYAPGASPASALGALLADDASAAPLLSADGRYAVFQTTASVLLGPGSTDDVRPAAGLVRKDLVTGAVASVAPPREVRTADGSLAREGTSSGVAGISADGRYVLFTTAARLTPGDRTGAATDVYVRDMGRPVTDTAAYELASARDGSDAGADTTDDALGRIAGAPGYALSADGRRAVFVTTGRSDLPALVAPTAPARQVWVRDLDARTTRLVSRRVDDPSTEGTPAPAPTGVGSAVPTAAISGDGSTVVWTAGDGQLQTPTLAGEAPFGPQPSLLTRRLSSITAPARRVAGAVDLDDPACAPGSAAPGPSDGGPCAGPFQTSEGVDFSGDTSSLVFEGLSHDGARVLLASSARRRPFDPLAYRASTSYLADIRPGVSRKSGVTVAWSYPNVAGRFPMLGGRLAPDGRHATFSSRDNRFDGLQPVGAFPTGDLVTFNVFVADLDARNVELVTRGEDGGDYVTASRPSTPSGIAVPSSDAGVIALPAPDGNLFVGDANGVDDVLIARRAVTTVDRGVRVLPVQAPPPATDETPAVPLRSRFFATIGRVSLSRRTGTATLQVAVPTAGTLSASARGTQQRTVRAKGRSRRITSTVTVGSARQTPKRATTVRLTIKVGAKAKVALRRSPHALDVRLSLVFRPRDADATTATRSYRLKRSDVASLKPKKKRPSAKKRSSASAKATATTRSSTGGSTR
ncbi:hypothetical protein [Patulibacter sp.]|uniref:hypothetical protein n=1 Tax=Patulibacter sp. TaxID=1912859 RepID=UPI002727E521|nr:hypothetical protein [Patulibacter sp.]MDO9409964.1 hypothetical protein [Patulibacter sp.]